jgi:hypothetical protein
MDKAGNKIGNILTQHIKSLAKLMDKGFISISATIIDLPDLSKIRTISIVCLGELNIFLNK